MLTNRKITNQEGMTPFERGRQDAENGMPINHCPFLKNSEKSVQWRDGFAAKQVFGE